MDDLDVTGLAETLVVHGNETHQPLVDKYVPYHGVDRVSYPQPTTLIKL